LNGVLCEKREEQALKKKRVEDVLCEKERGARPQKSGMRL
jgi:hypothetical protein